MTNGILRFGFTAIRSHGAGEANEPFVIPSPHLGPPPDEGSTVCVVEPVQPFFPGATIAGSQHSCVGAKPAEPKVLVPPPVPGQTIEVTRVVIPQLMVAP